MRRSGIERVDVFMVCGIGVVDGEEW